MRDHSMNVSFWILLLTVIEVTTSVEVHFENKDGGFFLKHTPKQQFQTIPDLSSVLPSSSTPSSILSVDRFTVFQSSQPISIRATYGPFSTKQTVPARYIVPDPLDSLPIPEHNASTTSVDLQELVTHHLDMSAHIVRTEIPRDSPVLRVLFHTGSDPGGRRQLLITRHQRVCIVLHATMGNKTPLSAACSPDGEDGVCLAQVTIPASWWSPLPPPDKNGRPGKPVKTPPKLVQVSYSVLEPRPADGEGCLPRIQIQPMTVLGFVPLVPAKAAYKELRLGEIITMLIPHPPLFPLSRFHIPVFMERERSKELTAVVIRARVKSGLRILSATPSTDQWNISIEINAKHTGATVSALRREPQEPDQSPPPTAGEVSELFSWLVEVIEGAEDLYEGAKMVWATRFEPHAPEPHRSEFHRMHSGGNSGSGGGGGGGSGSSPETRKPTTKLEVQKDDIQAVVPISKNWEVMNTAVLTGRQVSQAMKVFIVSQAGKAADVTLQSSCHSEDESVLKVSSSCSSVYVDGSEARGSVNGSVLVKYATYTGLARFTVWMPEFPLDLTVPDVRLSQIKSWKVPDYHANVGKVKRKKRSFGGWGPSMLPEDFSNGVGPERLPCRLRYQQSPVDVYAHFLANDHDSGRVTYFVNRRTWLRVTDLVLPLLRVSDPRIASLHGRILQGRSMGRTEVQVLSPITGRVIGAKEVRVVNDKVGLSKLSVRVVSGLQLNISPDSSIENGYIAETSVTRRLTAQYQEGLLDIELEFSDGSKTPLRDIADADYHLVVKSLDTEVVAFAPMVASHHPRVIAVGEGSGDLLQVSLLLNEDCRIPTRPKISGKSPGPLATAAAEVEVDFSVSEIPHRPDFVQNDGGMLGGPRDRKGGTDVTDLHDILIGMPLKDENNHEPTVQARQHHSLINNGVLNSHGRGVTRYQQPVNMSPLEIGMYVLLAAFCFAIVVFVVSCVVYASKFKPQGMDAQLGGGTGTAAVPSLGRSTIGMGTSLGIIREPRKPRESTTNAHDWVWLGRATLERSSGQMVQTSGRSSTINNNIPSTEMRITTNPMNLNYSEPDDCIVQATSFDNPNHIELPSRHIDSATYCKKDRSNNNGQSHSLVNINNNNNNTGLSNVAGSANKESQDWDKSIPPPLPPHAVPLQPDISSEDYKPPVPPHRNIGVTARISPSSSSPPVAPPPRKHHHHHHHRNSKHQAFVEPKKSAFEFDDTEPQSEFEHEIFQLAQQKADKVNFRHKNKNDTDDNVEFVQFPQNTDGNSNGIARGNSPEVKRATIIGNPMFSANAEVHPLNGENVATPADLSGLDDLQLDMDYDQIMHYFDNLKESNA